MDRHGLPLSVSTHAANHHEVTLVQLSFDFYMLEARPEHLIGDRAYDSDPKDAELAEEGVKLIAPHHKNRKKRKTQDGRQLRRYASVSWWSDSLPGSSGSVACPRDGSSMRTSWICTARRDGRAAQANLR